MQTGFSLAQLADPKIADADAILRNCVHCGFCTATCPTYVTLGNEMDSPRGRVYLIKDMLENDRAADEKVATHIDRCLSCLSCMTTCPSGVDYMHLVDHAREHVEKTYQRPLSERLMRNLLVAVLPFRNRFAMATRLAAPGKPFISVFDRIKPLKPVAAMLKLAPSRVAGKNRFVDAGSFTPESNKRGRVALLTGCAQPVLDSGINQATIELLNRLDVEVVLPQNEACCGSLVHHMGREDEALDAARHMVDVWCQEIEKGGLDAIVITTSGCGTTVKDYGHMLRHDPNWSEKAAAVSALTKDVSEYLAELDLPEPVKLPQLVVAYHSACSLQHGQQVKTLPADLLKSAGFEIRSVPEGYLCCGSAGTYNILQPDISEQLRKRKMANIEKTMPDVIAAGNIGCLMQIGRGTSVPVVHTVKLLNWAYGGDKPLELAVLNLPDK